MRYDYLISFNPSFGRIGLDTSTACIGKDRQYLPYCFFSSGKASCTLPCELLVSQPVAMIVKKLFDEGVYEIEHISTTLSMIDRWLAANNAKHITFVKNVYLKKQPVSQFDVLHGTFTLKRDVVNPARG